MKKTLIMGLLTILPTMSFGENPDSRASITFGLSGSLWSLDYNLGGPTQDGNGEEIGFNGLIAVPTSENITLLFGLGYNAGNTEWEQNIFFLSNKTDYTGFNFRFSVKFYIGNSINK